MSGHVVSELPENVRPLTLPKGGIPPPGFVESCLIWLPIFGWIVAAEIEKDRFQPVRQFIERQIAARPECVEALWAGDERRQLLATFVRRALADSYRWPNDRFIPADPINVIGLDDDGELLEIVSEALEHLGVPSRSCNDTEFAKLHKMTIGELTDWLLSMADEDVGKLGQANGGREKGLENGTGPTV